MLRNFIAFIIVLCTLVSLRFQAAAQATSCEPPASVRDVTVGYPSCDGIHCDAALATCEWETASDASSYAVKVEELETGKLVRDNVLFPASVSRIEFPVEQGRTYKCGVSVVNACSQTGTVVSDQLLCAADMLLDPTSTPPSPSIDPVSVVAGVSEAKIVSYMESLVDDNDSPQKDETQTRYTGTTGNEVEAQYIKSHFESLDLDTTLQFFPVGSRTTANIIARMEGESEETYLMTSHMDSTAQTASGVIDPAPGADDNGSGTVAVMEAARVLSQLKGKLKYSLEFVTFSGEEQGLFGSYHYVSALGGKKIRGVINLDMVGNDSGSQCVEFGYKNYNGGDVLSAAVLESISANSIPLQTRQFSSSMGLSDHKPFWDRGIPAIFGIECEFSPVYHSVNDKINRVNYGQITNTTKAIVGALYTLSK